jgi:hypothetical protein
MGNFEEEMFLQMMELKHTYRYMIFRRCVGYIPVYNCIYMIQLYSDKAENKLKYPDTHQYLKWQCIFIYL